MGLRLLLREMPDSTMNGVLVAACLAVLLLPACSRAPQPVAHTAPTTVAWVKPDGAVIDPIFAQAKAANKPVFLYWGAVWCPPCNQIKATVFNRPDFIARSQLFVPVYLDGDTPGAQKLGARFKVRGCPTMILFKSDGTELLRLPGEVDAARYMELLSLGLAADSSVRQSLRQVLDSDGSKLSADQWRLLAYYAWDQDEAQLVSSSERTMTLQKLASLCPPAHGDACTRLTLKAISAAARDQRPLPDPERALISVRQILADPAQTRANFDVLISDGVEIVGALTRGGSSERDRLLAQWNDTLDSMGADPGLSSGDRLSATSTKVALARLGHSEKGMVSLPAGLLAEVRKAVAEADKHANNPYERQAVIPAAADLLSEAGLLDESDALLRAELPRAISAYYHMLVLAANAKRRGDHSGSLDWAEQAWNAAQGPATRLQWGSGFVNRLIELTPQDVARIERSAMRVLAEIEAVPETFYERNRRGLERMGQRLLAWSREKGHTEVVARLSGQLSTVCSKLPPLDEARTTCAGLFVTPAGAAKAPL